MPCRRWSLLLCGPCLSWEGSMPKVGDIVRLDYVVRKTTKDAIYASRRRYGPYQEVLNGRESYSVCVWNDEPGLEIVKGPWVPAVGDVIVPLCAGHHKYDYTIKAIVEDRAWVSWFNSRGEENGFIVSLKHYKLKETSS